MQPFEASCGLTHRIKYRLYCEQSIIYQSTTDQAGRERNVGPLGHVLQIDPFHLPALFTPYITINFCYICKIVPVISSMWYRHCVLEHHCKFVIYACTLPEPLISRFSAILKSSAPLCGTYWYEMQRDNSINPFPSKRFPIDE